VDVLFQDGSVHRRTGGLENNVVQIKAAQKVHRRTGGLET